MIALQQNMFAIAKPGYIRNLDDIILESSESIALKRQEEETEMSGEQFVILKAVVSVQVGFVDGMAYVFREGEEKVDNGKDVAKVPVKKPIKFAKVNPMPARPIEPLPEEEDEEI